MSAISYEFENDEEDSLDGLQISDIEDDYLEEIDQEVNQYPQLNELQRILGIIKSSAENCSI